jgi:biopolymer transport protein ExbB
MGLLGTVVGLINAFAAVANVNPAERTSLLSASISVAMNNTALGLGLAITLLLSHMYLESKTTALVSGLEVASMKFLNSVAERRGESQRTLSPAQVAAQLGVQAVHPARATQPR